MKNYLEFNLTVDGRIDATVSFLSVADKLEDGEFTISDKKYKLGVHNALYFLPGVNVPRVKLKNLVLSHNISTTKDINKASHIFGNKSSYWKMVESKYCYSIPLDIFKEYLNLSAEVIEDYDKKNIKDALEFYTEDVVCVDYNTRRNMSNDDFPYITTAFSKKFRDSVRSHYSNIIKSSYIDIYKNIQGKEILDEACLIESLNGDDAITINKEQFEQIEAMILSSDEDNQTLAMEIMANCDYKKSLIYLLILFEKHGHIFQSNRTKNHVNFKSVLSYLDIERRYMSIHMDKIMEVLITKKALTEEWIDIVYNTYKDKIRQRESHYFNLHTVTLSPPALEALNLNYTRQMVEDYTPVLVEEVEKVEEEIVPSIMWI